MNPVNIYLYFYLSKQFVNQPSLKGKNSSMDNSGQSLFLDANENTHTYEPIFSLAIK